MANKKSDVGSVCIDIECECVGTPRNAIKYILDGVKELHKEHDFNINVRVKILGRMEEAGGRKNG